MDLIYAIILGAIQGLTEFLPVSSSGHLVVAQTLIPNFSQPGVLFDVVLHLGTLLSVIIIYRKKLLKLDLKYLGLIVAGTVPAVVVGFLFQDQLELMFAGLNFVAISFIITGIMNLAVDRFNSLKEKIDFKDSFIIGIAQAVAIIPAISRSGSTIFAGSALGIKKENVAEFSFILSIPAILGATVLQLVTYGGTVNILAPYYILGFISSLVFGILSIKIALKLLLTKNFKIFGIYCIILGAIIAFL